MWKHCIKKSINTEVQLRRFNIKKRKKEKLTTGRPIKGWSN
jgi:hypothetical protein